MSRLKGFRLRFGALFRADAAERRVREEFAFHLEMEIERHLAAGRSTDEARRLALIAFGGIERYQEEMRDGRALGWLRDAAADLRYGWRAMRRNIGVSGAIALALGVGIGINGFTYWAVDNLFVRELPVRAADRLVGIFRHDAKSGEARNFTLEQLQDFRATSNTFADVAGMAGVPLTLTVGDARPEQVWGEIVTPNYFSMLDMSAMAGRFFQPAARSTEPTAVLSYDSWRTRFHEDAAIVGRRIRVNGANVVIAGVAPRGFRGMRRFGYWPELWLPLEASAAGWRGTLVAFGRLKDGWDAKRLGDARRSGDITLVPAASGFDNPSFIRPPLLTLSAALAILGGVATLFIICANLANLQLARIGARTHELAIRLSLGCSRVRLVRQLAAETAVLGVPAGAIATGIVWTLPLLEPFMLPSLPFRVGADLAPNVLVAAFAALGGLIALLFIGVVPALRATRAPLAARRRTALRTALVVSQLALSFVLLVSGMLFTRSLFVARANDRGFDTDDRLLVSVNLRGHGYDDARGRRFYDDVAKAVRARSDVRHASWAFPVPFDTQDRRIALFVERGAAPVGPYWTEVSVVADDFERALGLDVVAGRTFVRSDDAGAPAVLAVSQTLSAALWPGEDPIGKRTFLGSASGRPVTVIGTIGDANFQPRGDPNLARAYLPLQQHYRDWQTLIVHTRGDAMALLPAVREIVASYDRALPLFGAVTLADAVASGFSPSRMAAAGSVVMSLLALLIAAVGLYAVVAANVSERRREIGIRLALGSTRRQLVRFVLADAARLGAWSLAAGLAGAIVLARAIAGLLYGVPPFDPVTFAAVPIALSVTVLAATYLPARRAAKLDVMAVLRND